MGSISPPGVFFAHLYLLWAAIAIHPLLRSWQRWSKPSLRRRRRFSVLKALWPTMMLLQHLAARLRGNCNQREMQKSQRQGVSTCPPFLHIRICTAQIFKKKKKKAKMRYCSPYTLQASSPDQAKAGLQHRQSHTRPQREEMVGEGRNQAAAACRLHIKLKINLSLLALSEQCSWALQGAIFISSLMWEGWKWRCIRNRNERGRLGIIKQAPCLFKRKCSRIYAAIYLIWTY